MMAKQSRRVDERADLDTLAHGLRVERLTDPPGMYRASDETLTRLERIVQQRFVHRRTLGREMAAEIAALKNLEREMLGNDDPKTMPARRRALERARIRAWRTLASIDKANRRAVRAWRMYEE